MADKYIYNNGGIYTEREATVTSAGAGNAGDILALDAAGKIDTSVLPTGVGADTETIPASENLSAGDFVNIYDDSGTVKCRKADASNTRPAHGFVLAAVTAPNNASVYRSGANNQLSSLTKGSRYYLSGSTAGAITAIAPSTTAHIVQYVGIASSATNLNFIERDYLVLA